MSGHCKTTGEPPALDLDTPPSLQGPGECPPGTKMAAAAGWLSAVLLLVAVGATVGGCWLLRSPHAHIGLVAAAFVTGIFFFISSAVVPLGVLRECAFEAEVKENCRNQYKDLVWALKGIKDPTLGRLASFNFHQLTSFIGIAQRQARTSYYVSVAAAAISLLTLASGAAAAIGMSATTTGKVAVGVLTTAGSVLSGFFAKTFLKSYQMASLQMSYYYGQPLVHCYLMHAQWLASEAGQHSGNATENRLWQEVVGASIKASAKAQNHLLTMHEHDGGRPGTGSGRRKKTPQVDQVSEQLPMLDIAEIIAGGQPPTA